MSDLIFLDSAGSSIPPAEVVDEVVGHLRRETEIGGYRAAAERRDDIEAGYGVLAELFGCEPSEVAFTDSATRSWLTAFDAVPLAKGDRILVTEVEYGGNAVPMLRRAEETGATIEVMPSDRHGQLDVGALELDERVKLISLVHVPTNGGLVNPVNEVTTKAREVGALVLLDACQSTGQIDLRGHDYDMLVCTGRKWLRGPRGTGALVVRNEVRRRLKPRLMDHSAAEWVAPDRYEPRDDARVFELWEYSVADRLGMIAAAKYALAKGLDVVEAEVGDRAKRLRTGLASIPGITVQDLGERQSGIVTFTSDRVPAMELKDRLWQRDVAVTVSQSGSTLIDMTRRGLDEVVRASPHYFVTPEEIDQALDRISSSR
ncbi:aminotransferase class V-fold PLP-dependent enzyme [Lentzea sp. NBC_00516]|uniref:aminotransferase class V-fold PLP-dependent enzyme n=1 Tax=Lentzea sp. NBC_00516 TaxID=2903582 RepID=UPI002E822CFA|nr:aminotransferase class V-fold PLP-dependent enzyme [Lentzea sp. NBC_00516]WUD24556.1 aminotransferase class V-fold PLP-dependent enzyme [Lentzea sp. NBC_00516]